MEELLTPGDIKHPLLRVIIITFRQGVDKTIDELLRQRKGVRYMTRNGEKRLKWVLILGRAGARAASPEGSR